MYTDEQKAYDLIAELHDLAGQYEVMPRPMRDSIESRMYDCRLALERLTRRAERHAQARFDREWTKRLAQQADDPRFQDGYEPPEPHYDPEPTRTLHGAQ